MESILNVRDTMLGDEERLTDTRDTKIDKTHEGETRIPFVEVNVGAASRAIAGIEHEPNLHYLFDLDIHLPDGGISSAYSLEAERLGIVPLPAKNIREVREGDVIQITRNPDGWPVRVIYTANGESSENEFHGYRWPKTIRIPFGKIEGIVYKATHHIVPD